MTEVKSAEALSGGLPGSKGNLTIQRIGRVQSAGYHVTLPDHEFNDFMTLVEKHRSMVMATTAHGSARRWRRPMKHRL